jgi:PQQ-like domain
MTRTITIVSGALALSIGLVCIGAQGRSAPDWTVQGGDAQRTSWVRVDPWISLDSFKEPDGFRLLWKLRLDTDPQHADALTAPVSQANINTFRGFKSTLFVGSRANTVYAIDYDFGTLLWTTHFNYSSGVAEYAGSPRCPGGMTSAVTRATGLVPTTLLPFMGFARPPRPARGEVGEPRKGAPQLGPGGTQQARGAGGAARGAAPPPPAAPVDAAARARIANTLFAVSGDGLVRPVNAINGDTAAMPVMFLPPNATVSGLIHADGVMYAITSNGCGGAPEALWGLDWNADDKPVTSWRSDGATITGPALALDGTVYVGTGEGRSTYADSIVALDSKTLKVKDWFTGAGAHFVSSPIAFDEGGKSFVAAASADRRLFILDGASLGGSDHKSASSQTTLQSRGTVSEIALATWRDPAGMRWILAALKDANGGGELVALKGASKNGVTVFERSWSFPVGRTLEGLGAPLVINGVLFALAGGSAANPAVLYALNPENGQEIWTSGAAMTSSATANLSAGTGQVYVVTGDNSVWAFGVPQSY